MARKDWNPPIRTVPLTVGVVLLQARAGQGQGPLHVLGRLGEGQPGGGRRVAGGRALEQGVAGLPLQLAELLGHRGGRDGKLVGRCQHAAVARHGEQEAQPSWVQESH